MSYSYDVLDSALNHPELSDHDEPNWLGHDRMVYEYTGDRLPLAPLSAGAENDLFPLINPLPHTQPNDINYQPMPNSCNFALETFHNQPSNNIVRDFSDPRVPPFPGFFFAVPPSNLYHIGYLPYPSPFRVDPAPASVLTWSSTSAYPPQAPMMTSSLPETHLLSDPVFPVAPPAEAPPLSPSLQHKPCKY